MAQFIITTVAAPSYTIGLRGAVVVNISKPWSYLGFAEFNVTAFVVVCRQAVSDMVILPA